MRVLGGRQVTEQWTIIGAESNWEGSAPFMRAPPLVQSGNEYAYATRYSGDNAHLTAVLEKDIAQWSCRFDPVPLEPKAEVWVLRKSFPFLDAAARDLHESECVIHGPSHHEDVMWAVVRYDTEAQTLLQEWCDRAADEAVEAGALAYGAEHSLRERAMNCASLSFSLCNAPAKTGLYLAILEAVGRTDWHNQTAAMIESTRGFYFYQAALAQKTNVLVRLYRRRCEQLELANDDLRRRAKLP